MRNVAAILLACAAAFTTASALGRVGPERLFTDDFNSQAWGVNERGDIVGGFTSQERPDRQDIGFLYTNDARVVTLQPPGEIWTIALDINNRREVVGQYMDEEFSWHGFAWSRSAGYRTVDVQQGRDNYLTGINSNRMLIGYVGNTLLGAEGFVIRRGRVEMLHNPFGYAVTIPTGISENGTIVGYLTEPTPDRGFILRNGEWRLIDEPSGSSLDLFDISPAGTIVGAAHAVGGPGSFTFRNGKFRHVHLPLFVLGVNASGLLVGSVLDADGHSHAVRWTHADDPLLSRVQ